MGISFIADGEAGPLKIEVQGGRYRPAIIKIKGKEGAKDPERKLWLRVPVKADYILDLLSGNEARWRKDRKAQGATPALC
jgi:hypothetical protein